MKKVFIVTGELSGDQTAAWYVYKMRALGGGPSDVYYEAVGGDDLQHAGVKIVQRFEILNVTGFVEVLARLPAIFRFLRWLVEYIKKNQFHEVVLVDFPGFNLKLAARLCAECPQLKIIYLAPPQLWCWGAWRLKKIKKCCHEIIVVYPFEVEWYAQRGVAVRWIGLPVYDKLAPYLLPAVEKKQLVVALIPGSRPAELARILPVMIKVASMLYQQFPQLQFVMPVARSLSQKIIDEELNKISEFNNQLPLKFVYEDAEKYRALSACCLALTKPGTVTLELGLLRVPSLVIYRTSWITYFLAWLVAHVRYMALPNLFLNREIFPEFVQKKCSVEVIAVRAHEVLERFLKNGSSGQEQDFDQLKKVLEI